MTTSEDEYRAVLSNFAQRVPTLLAGHETTAALGLEVAGLELNRQLQRRFTVAVVGRMKAGKSTLINALIGRRLAPVAVEQATATVNWFDYGDAGTEISFEVYWKDKSREKERLDLKDLDSFLGTSDLAEQVEHLHFHAASPFLRTARIYDTPGTQSTIESHEAAAIDLVTRRYGERADAVILVLPTKVSRADQEQVLAFAEQTRFPGQGPYNTIAVLQKWETLEAIDPEEEAKRLAEDFQHRLEGRVSEVLPVSGLLAIMVQEVPFSAFEKLAYLASRTSTSDLEALLKMDGRFVTAERTGFALSKIERQQTFVEVRDALLGNAVERGAGTYEMIKLATFAAHRRSINNGETLRNALHEMSGLDRLREVLERRFFAVSGLIRAGSVLKKALEPCQMARQRLRDGLERRRELVQEGQRLLSIFGVSSGTGIIDRARNFLDATVPLLREDIRPIDSMLRELESLIDTAEHDFRLLMLDIECIETLETVSSLPNGLERAMRHLCGQFGMERHHRLGLVEDAGLDVQIKAAETLSSAFSGLRWGRSGAVRALAEHALLRLHRIQDSLDMGGEL